jgi:hypothetical protein
MPVRLINPGTSIRRKKKQALLPGAVGPMFCGCGGGSDVHGWQTGSTCGAFKFDLRGGPWNLKVQCGPSHIGLGPGRACDPLLLLLQQIDAASAGPLLDSDIETGRCSATGSDSE